MIDVRCPDCRRLLFKCSPDNHSPIETRCPRCKETVRFKGFPKDETREAAHKTLDTAPALG